MSDEPHLDATAVNSVNADPSEFKTVHIFLIVHGLWGVRSHLRSLEEMLLEKAAKDCPENEEIQVWHTLALLLSCGLLGL
jgi:hypothetical protein